MEPLEPEVSFVPQEKSYTFTVITYSIGALFFVLGFLWIFFIRPTEVFPTQTVITVEKGETLSVLAQSLESQGFVRSGSFFKIMVILFHGQKTIQAGDYYFENALSTWGVAQRLTSGEQGLITMKVTFPEGSSVAEIAKIMKGQHFTLFNEKEFKKYAKEGFLFPDTYNVLPSVTAKQLIEMMSDNFVKKVATLQPGLRQTGKSLDDIVKMASIVEEEARTIETRRIVAGILWRRIAIGMPLQVDASFLYINGKSTSQLSFDDLKIDSPYNSYLYKGLPPTPITNPGLDSLIATITPIKTHYLYFLSDDKGNMHYAKTFAEHVANKEKYLR